MGREPQRTREGPAKMPTVYARTLRRAAEIMGEDKLAAELGVSVERVKSWTTGLEEPPLRAFLKAVDIVSRDSPTEPGSA